MSERYKQRLKEEERMRQPQPVDHHGGYEDSSDFTESSEVVNHHEDDGCASEFTDSEEE